MDHTPDMDVAGAAVAAPISSEPAHTEPAPAAQAVADEALALQIEALLITSGRAITVQRLGEALGLIARPDAQTGASTAESQPAPDAVGEAAATEADQPAIVTRVKRRSKRHAGDPNSPAPATPQQRIEAAIQSLNTVYAQTGRSFRIEPMAGGYRFMTLPRFGATVSALHGASAGAKLSRAAIETLAIIAYKQPITRGKLEAVRGCACGEVLKSLTERRLVTIAGRAEELGRPLLYATSRQFLDAFGLSSLKDLPTSAELK